jgi:hypothetical protein
MITGGCISTVILAPKVDGGQQHPLAGPRHQARGGRDALREPWYAAAPDHNDKHVFAGTTRIGTPQMPSPSCTGSNLIDFTYDQARLHRLTAHPDQEDAHRAGPGALVLPPRLPRLDGDGDQRAEPTG